MPKKGRSNRLACLAMLTGWLLASALSAPVTAIQLDSKGEIQLGLRTYTAARIGTEDTCLLYTSPSPRDRTRSRMPSSA